MTATKTRKRGPNKTFKPNTAESRAMEWGRLMRKGYTTGQIADAYGVVKQSVVYLVKTYEVDFEFVLPDITVKTSFFA